MPLTTTVFWHVIIYGPAQIRPPVPFSQIADGLGDALTTCGMRITDGSYHFIQYSLCKYICYIIKLWHSLYAAAFYYLTLSTSALAMILTNSPVNKLHDWPQNLRWLNLIIAIKHENKSFELHKLIDAQSPHIAITHIEPYRRLCIEAIDPYTKYIYDDLKKINN